MATYTFVARDDAGTQCTGEIQAKSTADAARALRGDGKYVVNLEAQTTDQPTAAPLPIGTRRVRRIDVLYFTSQMSLMVETGVPIADALDGIIRQTPAGGLHRVLTDLRRRVEAGEPFSKALSHHPKVFGSLFVNMIRASEMTGKLGETLSRIARHMTEQREMIGKIRGALIYPCVLLVMATGAIIFLMTFIMPKFTVMYQGRESLLPVPTKILLATSDWMIAYWPYWSTGTIAATVVAYLFLTSPRGRPLGHWLLINSMIIGSMYRKALLTRSLQTLGTLIDSGVSMVESVGITRHVVNNHYFEKMWDDAGAALQRGRQLSEPLYENKLMPRALAQMIEAGERSGQIGPVMKRIADYLDVELRSAILAVTRLIEPLMIVIAGTIIGGIALALLLPIFTISRNISQF